MPVTPTYDKENNDERDPAELRERRVVDPGCRGRRSATEVRDASTGEVVARVSTEGLDLGAALEYARTVGQASSAR